MANGESNGNTAGNRQINANTGVTIGLVVVVLGVTVTAVWKASEVVTDMSHLKLYVLDLRSEVAEMKRIIQRIDSKQSGAAGK